jgi:predicted DNA-binding protein (MmcQ/YjbR family)
METARVSPRKAFEAIRSHCLAKAGAVEEYPWGAVVWKARGKVFAIGHAGENAFTVKATPADQAVLTHHPAIERAAYVGRFGWVTITVTDEETLALARTLVDLAHESLQPKRR